jgi:hypothetical protein
MTAMARPGPSPWRTVGDALQHREDVAGCGVDRDFVQFSRLDRFDDRII